MFFYERCHIKHNWHSQGKHTGYHFSHVFRYAGMDVPKCTDIYSESDMQVISATGEVIEVSHIVGQR